MKKIIFTSQDIVEDETLNSQDRLGDLPDCLIRHILSFMETKDAIQTCVLSTRWRHLWPSIPCLNFNSKSVTQLVDFKKFVFWVLSRRNTSQVKVLIYHRFGVHYATYQYLLNKVVRYASSHDVEEIRINLQAKTFGSPPIEIPFSLFTCQSLKRLEFKDFRPTNAPLLLGSKSLEMLHLERFSMYPTPVDHSNPFASLAKLFSFTTLTTMHLNSVALWCYTEIDSLDPFANCVNLKNLHISEMSFKPDLNPKNFVISAPQLKNLSLTFIRFKCKIVVAAPQLTNFSYLYCKPSAFFEFSLPSLDGSITKILGPHGGLKKAHQKKREETVHGFINMSRGHQNSEAVKLSYCMVAVTCGTTVLVKPECLSFRQLKSLNLTCSLTTFTIEMRASATGRSMPTLRF